MTWTVATERGTERRGNDALDDQLANHAHKSRMGSGGAGALVADAKFPAAFAGLGIKIEDDLDVVGDESDGDQHEVFCTAGMLFFDHLEDVRREPGLRGRSAAALVDEAVVWVRERFSHKAGGFFKLLHVAGGGCHRHRNAVSSKEQARTGTAFGRNLRKRFAGMRGERFNESGVVVEGANLIDLRRAFANHALRGGNVFAVLPAAGVGAIRRREKAQAR